MRGCRMCAAAAIAAFVSIPPSLCAQQPQQDSAAAAAPSPEAIRRELEKIKTGRTLVINPADGTNDSDGATILTVENGSASDLIVLVVGPTTRRVELGSERMEMLTIEPGDYELAVTAVGRIGRTVLPFYGRQKIVAGMSFHHKFVISGG
jgi:hypothetical protein